jgi:hypothetical protein
MLTAWPSMITESGDIYFDNYSLSLKKTIGFDLKLLPDTRNLDTSKFEE